MLARLALPAVAALALACATTPAERVAAWRAPAVSPRTFERVLPFLEALKPGDDLRIFERSREVHWLPPARRRGPRRPVVVMPSWITSLSGGAPGGLSMFGQLVARVRNTVHGSHVFGYVVGDRIVPRYQVLTTATLISRQEYEALQADHTPDIGVLPRPEGLLYFRELHVAGARPLAFSDPSAAAASDADLPSAPAPRPGGPATGAGDVDPPVVAIAAFYSEASFRRIEPVLHGLPLGTDLFGMLSALDARFVSNDFGETHAVFAPGFLNTRHVRTRTLEGPAGLVKLRPFGWLEGDREVVRLVAIFENDRLTRVVPHAGSADWAAEALGS
jgi:hypothetical protein